jgi:ATP-binding cassette, subfamily B, bacterial
VGMNPGMLFGGFRGGHPGRHEGLPFGGIPPEMQPYVERLLADEPEVGEVRVEFSHRTPDTRPFTLRRFLAPHRWALLLGTLLVAIEIGAEQIGPLIFRYGIDRGIIPKQVNVVFVAAVAFMGSILVNAIARRIRTAWTGRLGETLMYELRVRVFSHLQRLSLNFYTGEKSGRIMTRMTSDIEALSQLFQDGLVNLIVQGFTLLVVLGVIFSMNVTLAWIVTLGILPLMLVASIWFRRASDVAFLNVRNRISDVLADLAENLAGMRVVQLHNRGPRNARRHRRIVGEHREANLVGARISSIYGPGVEAIGVIGQLLVLVVGGRMVVRGELTPGELTAFIFYLAAFFAPIQQLVQLYTTYQQGRAAVVKLRELLAEEPSVPEASEAAELPPIHGAIALEDVTFGYDANRPVLTGVSLKIPEGETFALVGPTGAGKSTIAKLVTRFYDPQHGRVTVDGHDVRGIGLASLRRQLGVVPQEPFLFLGTIRDNIAFARPGATDDEVREACRAVGIGELIDRMPDGLDTLVHERGVTLSSGERQLVALARAFLAQPRVLVLDEATSNLDLGTEAMVERALDVLLEGRTAILIAHRLSTAMRADRIAVVQDGGIAEIGSHADLIARGGRYAHMFDAWLRHGSDVDAGAHV